MSTECEPLLLDTNAAIALVDAGHALHQAVSRVVRGRPLGLAGHAAFEFMRGLTIAPWPVRRAPAAVRRLIEVNFPETRFLEARDQAQLVADFASIGLIGGAVYDGLVAACARAHGLTLVTCDKRAQSRYEALGVDYILVTDAATAS
ncbi:MAG: PIN domain-containing protein [Propionibacteriaceae bacterium]|jgi:predicted nucleic acid-binding protein|nr:PIN domain-containing protein [Propionibacteriaceae bacterium]